MSAFLSGVAVYLLLTVPLVGLRLLRGPTTADRMLAVTLIGTTVAAVLLLLSVAGGRPALLDGALLVALLTAVPVLAFSLRISRRRSSR
jgi:multicomponent Na+:H+ antiporter subunit F